MINILYCNIHVSNMTVDYNTTCNIKNNKADYEEAAAPYKILCIFQNQ